MGLCLIASLGFDLWFDFGCLGLWVEIVDLVQVLGWVLAGCFAL